MRISTDSKYEGKNDKGVTITLKFNTPLDKWEAFAYPSKSVLARHENIIALRTYLNVPKFKKVEEKEAVAA